jgi:hypothetical protein
VDETVRVAATEGTLITVTLAVADPVDVLFVALAFTPYVPGAVPEGPVLLIVNE